MGQQSYIVTIISNGSYVIEDENFNFVANRLKPDSDSMIQMAKAMEGHGRHIWYVVATNDLMGLIKHVSNEADEFCLAEEEN